MNGILNKVSEMCDPRKLRNVPLLRLFWVIISIFCCCFCQICGFQVHPSAPCSITNTGWSKSKGTLFHRKHGSTSSEHLSSIGEVSADMQVTQPGGDEDRINNIGNDDISSRTLLIHWRGEKDVGYSKPLRQLEFRSSLEAELNLLPSVVGGNANKLSVDFVNALNYTGQEKMGNVNIEHFNEGMQFVSLKFDDDAGGESGARRSVPRRSAVRAAERCSLIHALYEVVASSDSLEDLAELAIRDGGFADLFEGGANAKSTWCFRARNYGDASATGDDFEMDKAGRVKRYGSSARSMVVEREGLTALKDLLVRFGGEVDLRNPEIKICLFDGLEGLSSKALARRIATGPKVRLSNAMFNDVILILCGASIELKLFLCHEDFRYCACHKNLLDKHPFRAHCSIRSMQRCKDSRSRPGFGSLRRVLYDATGSCNDCTELSNCRDRNCS